MTDAEKKLVKIVKDMCEARTSCCGSELHIEGDEVIKIVEKCPLNRKCDNNKCQCSLFEVEDDQHLLEILTAD
ncbi:MAG: hypothetical protein MJ117_00445 [Lachnospiraceae bacterium]|nr:hypothetical protein [Lachnospiraceae bacterium]